MNTKKFILAVITIAALAMFTGAASALEYGVAKTLWSTASITNVPATATNLAAVVDVTKVTEFTLQANVGITNAATGTLDLRWSTSEDGVNYTSGLGVSGSSGWFSIPLTNAGTAVVWTTNVTVNSHGYWRLDWLTNQASGAHITNVSLKAFIKSKKY